jgi:hypothetical protein
VTLLLKGYLILDGEVNRLKGYLVEHTGPYFRKVMYVLNVWRNLRYALDRQYQ